MDEDGPWIKVISKVNQSRYQMEKVREHQRKREQVYLEILWSYHLYLIMINWKRGQNHGKAHIINNIIKGIKPFNFRFDKNGKINSLLKKLR